MTVSGVLPVTLELDADARSSKLRAQLKLLHSKNELMVDSTDFNRVVKIQDCEINNEAPKVKVDVLDSGSSVNAAQQHKNDLVLLGGSMSGPTTPPALASNSTETKSAVLCKRLVPSMESMQLGAN